MLTGIALVTGYGLLGACWLIWKTDGDLQARSRGHARLLGIATLGFIGAVSLGMLLSSTGFRERWLTFPSMAFAAPVPLLVLALSWQFFRSLDRPTDIVPFLCALGLFLLSYVGLAISLYPMIVPPSISIWDAATHPSSQKFLLVGAAILIPIVLAYTAYVYWIFRGKITAGSPGYH